MWEKLRRATLIEWMIAFACILTIFAVVVNWMQFKACKDRGGYMLQTGSYTSCTYDHEMNQTNCVQVPTYECMEGDDAYSNH